MRTHRIDHLQLLYPASFMASRIGYWSGRPLGGILAGHPVDDAQVEICRF